MSSPIALPLLRYPFEVRVSPFAADIDAACYRWGEQMGIYDLGDREEYRRTRVGWLASCTSPDGTPAGLRLLADWQMWLFAFDDGYCDESACGTRPDLMVRRIVDLVTVLDGGFRTGGGDPFRVALADLVTRVTGAATGVQRARFVSAVYGYLIAQCWEAANRAAGTPPSLEEYISLRRHSGAVRTCIALADVANGYELPAPDYDHPDVVALTDMAVNVASWANDILSYPKEVRRSRSVHSLPALVAHWRRIGHQAAMDAVVRMHDEEVRRFVAAEQRVRDRAGPALHRYLDDLRHWMTGNVHWSYTTGRYRLPSSACAAAAAHEGAGYGQEGVRSPAVPAAGSPRLP